MRHHNSFITTRPTSNWVSIVLSTTLVPAEYQVSNPILHIYSASQTLPKMPTINPKLHDLPEEQLLDILQYVTGFENYTDAELSKPIVRAGLQDTYMLFVIQYAILSVCGILINVAVICYIFRRDLYRDSTHALYVNLCICHFVQSAFVLPITLFVIIVHNWIMGQFMCYFIPMLQVSCILCTMCLSFLFLFWFFLHFIEVYHNLLGVGDSGYQNMTFLIRILHDG